MVLVQKGSDAIFARDSKMFGIRSRPNTMAKLTYIIAGIFFINTFALIAAYQNAYKSSLLKEEMIAEKNATQIIEQSSEEEAEKVEITKLPPENKKKVSTKKLKAKK